MDYATICEAKLSTGNIIEKTITLEVTMLIARIVLNVFVIICFLFNVLAQGVYRAVGVVLN